MKKDSRMSVSIYYKLTRQSKRKIPIKRRYWIKWYYVWLLQSRWNEWKFRCLAGYLATIINRNIKIFQTAKSRKKIHMENKRLIKNWKKSISNFPFYIKFYSWIGRNCKAIQHSEQAQGIWSNWTPSPDIEQKVFFGFPDFRLQSLQLIRNKIQYWHNIWTLYPTLTLGKQFNFF